MPLHWSTEVTSWFDDVVVVVQPVGGTTPAAARQAVAVTVELVAPWAVTVFWIVRVQVTSQPAPVGIAGGSHWATDGAVAACAWLPPGATSPKATTIPTETTKARATTRILRGKWIPREARTGDPTCPLSVLGQLRFSTGAPDTLLRRPMAGGRKLRHNNTP